jgi:hypothetical protein
VMAGAHGGALLGGNLHAGMMARYG